MRHNCIGMYVRRIATCYTVGTQWRSQDFGSREGGGGGGANVSTALYDLVI